MIDLLQRWRHARMLPLMLAAAAVVLVAVAAGMFVSSGGIGEIQHFASARLLERAYGRVEEGRTTQAQLAQMGFDPNRLNARTLSGLGVQEYFMPKTSAEYDRLSPAVRACFDAPDRCTAMVFPLGPAIEKGGFMSAYAAPRDPGQIIFLLKSGRVAYKAMNS